MTSGVKNITNYATFLPTHAALRNAAPWVTLALAVILGLAYIYRRYNTPAAPAPKDLDMPGKTERTYYQAPNVGENRWSTLPQPVIQIIFAFVEKETRITSRLVCRTWSKALINKCEVLPDLIDVRTIPIFHGIHDSDWAKRAYRNLKKIVVHVGGWENYFKLQVFDMDCRCWPEKEKGHYKIVTQQIAKLNPLYPYTRRDPFIMVNESHRVYIKPILKTPKDLSPKDLPAAVVRGLTPEGFAYIIYRDGSSIGQSKGIFIFSSNSL